MSHAARLRAIWDRKVEIAHAYHRLVFMEPDDLAGILDLIEALEQTVQDLARGSAAPGPKRHVRVELGPVTSTTRRGSMSTTPFKLGTQQQVNLGLVAVDAANVDVSSDVDPAGVTVTVDHPELAEYVAATDRLGGTVKAKGTVGTVELSIAVTDKQGTALPVVVQEIDLVEIVDEPVGVNVVFGAPAPLTP